MTFAIVEGSDARVGKAAARAYEKFLVRNPGIDQTLALAVVTTQFLDLLWRMTQHAEPQYGLTLDQAFLTMLSELGGQVTRGEHLIDDPSAGAPPRGSA